MTADRSTVETVARAIVLLLINLSEWQTMEEAHLDLLGEPSEEDEGVVEFVQRLIQAHISGIQALVGDIWDYQTMREELLQHVGTHASTLIQVDEHGFSGTLDLELSVEDVLNMLSSIMNTLPRTIQ